MRRKLLAPAALAVVLLVAARAWAPPPSGGGARPPSGGGGRPPVGGSGSRPSISGAKPAFGKAFDAARSKSATEAATVLRTQGIHLARSERAAMLNAVVHHMLRQQRAASLADLRRARTDWNAIGPGAGLDPIVAMELEAAEAAAERLVLAEVLQLVRDGRYTEAADRIGSLEVPRHPPAAVVHALPGLRDGLRRAAPIIQARAELNDPNASFESVWQQLSKVPNKELPAPVVRAVSAWSAVDRVRQMFAVRADLAPYFVDEFEPVLKHVTEAVGGELAGKFRVELAVRLFFDNRAKDATKLLEGPVDPTHAAAVLADVRAAVLGRGEFAVPQVAEFVPTALAAPPAYAAAVLPPDRLKNWKPPTRKPGETTVAAAVVDARKQLKAAVATEADALAARMNAAADEVRAALAAGDAPLRGFLEKVEVVRGKPLSQPVERQLAAVCGTRGLSVAETIGVLAADADRAASAARRLASVPVFTNPGAFAAAVELSGRAPAGFTPHADAGFKVVGSLSRARVRDAVAAILGAHASKAAAGQNPPAPARAEFEAEAAKRLGVAADAIAPAAVVQALLDVCRDCADDYSRLVTAARALDELIAEIRAERDYQDDTDLQAAFTIAKARRMSAQIDRKRAELGAYHGCRLLGAYGLDAKPAAAWLLAQDERVPWRGPAAHSYGLIAGGK